MKKPATKPKFGSQIMWFIGIYIVSVIAVGLFHELSKWLINLIK